MDFAGHPPVVNPGAPTLVKLGQQKTCEAGVNTTPGVNSGTKKKEKIRVVASDWTAGGSNPSCRDGEAAL
ncbi:hypothetical protein E2C01_059090 [Portunus trituberculatus]|uniref:Uncharacterized protein n=1 Tax=Portunus trituberculatus TaxID=210409 RepID=A0A5B7H6H0_PORTR|nr:hypothetical protein [Portunus trituberculatus]